MVALKPQDIDRIVASPPSAIAFYLVYGPDAGLVAERSLGLARAFADPADPFSLIRLDAATIVSDPSRLADEAYAVSMFGGRRAIVVRDVGARASLADLMAPMMRQPPPETAVIVEGGDLRKTNPLRALFERDKAAYAMPCYVDDAAAIGRLVDDEIREHGLKITHNARALLVSSLGGDRMLSRAEIRKLCLYAMDAGEVDVDDVMACVVDTAGVAVEEILDATATGDLPGLSTALARAAREGLDPSYLASSVMRYFHALDLARSAVDSGTSVDDAVAAMRPPVFFKRKTRVAQAVRVWTAPAINRGIVRLAATARDARLSGSLGRDILSDTLLTLAGHAARVRSR